MATHTTTENVQTLANTLFSGLVNGELTVPEAVDLTDPIYAQPSAENNKLYTPIERLDESDLTSRVVGGSGLFDGLMIALDAHMKTQYEKNRITGKDYADVYLGLTQAALMTASQYLMTTEQSYWQSVLAQKQAQAAEIALVNERVGLATNKARLSQAQTEAKMAQTNYALAKIQLLLADSQLQLTNEQRAQVEYQVSNMMPAELARILKETDAVSASISNTEAQTVQTEYTTASILPAQKAGILEENALKTYQLSDVMPAQVAGTKEDTLGKKYTNEFILPTQYLALKEQAEGYRASTKDSRTDGSAVAGSVGKQKELQQQQITSYKRDAEQKYAKMIVDTWITQKSVDDGLTAPTQFRDEALNAVLNKIRTNMDI